MPRTSPRADKAHTVWRQTLKNKKWFPHYGNQSNVISDQHILTQRQRGEECPIDWYCLLGRSRWSPEEKTSVAGLVDPPQPPPHSLPSSLYICLNTWGILNEGGSWRGLHVCVCVLSRCCRATLSHAGGVEEGFEKTEPSPARLLEC